MERDRHTVLIDARQSLRMMEYGAQEQNKTIASRVGSPFRSERPKFRYFFPFSLLTGKRISVRKMGDFGFKFKNMKVKLW